MHLAVIVGGRPSGVIGPEKLAVLCLRKSTVPRRSLNSGANVSTPSPVIAMVIERV